MTFDLNSTEAGDVSPLFTSFTRAANRSLIERSYNGTDFLSKVPAKDRDAAAESPERFKCTSVFPLRDKKQNQAEFSSVDLLIPLAMIYKQFVTSR